MRYLVLFFVIISMSFSGSSSAAEVKLPSPKREGKVSLERALSERRSIRQYAGGSLTLDEISQVLWAAYGKNKWGKLTSPSAGALYPLTIYLIAVDIEGFESGFYRYNNQKHSLYLISNDDLRRDLSAAALNQPCIKDAAAVIVICADYSITASRYGKRASRYVDMEVGHVGQNIYLEATALGLGTVAVGAFDDNKVKRLLDIKQDPLYIMPLGRIE